MPISTNFTQVKAGNPVGKGKTRMTRVKILSAIIVASALTILYINNVMQIDSLLLEIRTYEKEYESLRIKREIINARLISMESADRIIPLAESSLGLVLPSELPSRMDEIGKDSKPDNH